MDPRKPEIITFKADADLATALRGMPNRSEFIRSALMTALAGVCPLCNGTGTLSAAQRHHWDRFMQSHSITQCAECRATHLVCEEDSDCLEGGSH
ncbi:MAG: CopG family transcriptional regulator [Candidatus Hydrogenedentota bacterium]